MYMMWVDADVKMTQDDITRDTNSSIHHHLTSSFAA